MTEAKIRVIYGAMRKNEVTLSSNTNEHGSEAFQIDKPTSYRTFPHQIDLNGKPVYIEHSISPDGPVDVEIGDVTREIPPGHIYRATDQEGTTLIEVFHFPEVEIIK